MTNLEKLKKAIIKEIPEIVEKYEEEEVRTSTDNFADRSMMLQQVRPTGRTNVYERPITLSDVLSIIEMMYEDDEDEKTMPTSEIPQIKEVLNMWEFSKGDLENQSEYTIALLTDLICKKYE